MNKQINIAVLGAGYMGQNHVKVLSSLTDVNLVAICDTDKTKTQKLAKQYKIREYDNFLKLTKEEKLDAITICLPTSLHFRVAKECIKKRIPILLEKPICATVGEAKALVHLASKNKVPVMVGHIERFNPVVNEIKLRIKAGELGKIIKVHTQRFSPPMPTQQDVSVIVDLATHDIDALHYILDEPITRIYAETRHKLGKNVDLMSAIFRFKSGTIGLVEVSWLHPAKIRNLAILGERGMYQANYLTQELLFYRQNQQLFVENFTDHLTSLTKADVVKIAFQSREPLYLELSAFISALRTKSPMPVTAKDGLYTLKIVELFAKSGFTHRKVNTDAKNV